MLPAAEVDLLVGPRQLVFCSLAQLAELSLHSWRVLLTLWATQLFYVALHSFSRDTVSLLGT